MTISGENNIIRESPRSTHKRLFVCLFHFERSFSPRSFFPQGTFCPTLVKFKGCGVRDSISLETCDSSLTVGCTARSSQSLKNCDSSQTVGYITRSSQSLKNCRLSQTEGHGAKGSLCAQASQHDQIHGYHGAARRSSPGAQSSQHKQSEGSWNYRGIVQVLLKVLLG